jgi:hypothetical protein
MRILHSVAVLLASFVTVQANAGTITCSGRILQVSYHSPDAFMIQLESMNLPVIFCRSNASYSVSGTTYTTSPESCRTLVGMFTAGKIAERSIGVMYFDGDAVPSACNAWPAWQSVNIRHFAWAD